MTALSRLSDTRVTFPPVNRALKDPNGLLAMGGGLSPEWLLQAYQSGIFPWFNEDDGPILWWSPDPRAVLYPDQLHVTKSLAKRIRNGGFHITMDVAFEDVIGACSDARARNPAAGSPAAGVAEVAEGLAGTWITTTMRQAYIELHRLGFAHSVEVWLDGRLAGGLYGVSLGRMFFGESMFTRQRDGSKVALYHLIQQLRAWDFRLIDCQMMNDHLASLGAVEVPRRVFIEALEANANESTRQGPWTLEVDHAG